MRRISRTVLASLLVSLALWPAVGYAQTACTVPRQLGVAISFDNSSSMDSSDPRGLRGTGARLAIDSLPDGSVVAAGGWSEDREDFFGPTVLDPSNRSDLERKIAARGLSGTNFDVGFEQLTDFANAMPSTVDRKVAVFLSDGEDSDKAWFADVALADQHIPVYTIGLGASADDAALTEIAEGGGRTGKYYKATSLAEVQAAFADIVHTKLCQTPKTADVATLAPGETKTFPFEVKQTDRGWSADLTWAKGDFAVTVNRPDGTSFGATGPPNADELFAAGATSAAASASAPGSGTWSITAAASSSNSSPVEAAIHVYDAAGSALYGIDIPDKPVKNLTVPTIRAGIAGLRKVGGIPLHLYVQPTVGLGGKYSGGIEIPQAAADDDGGEQTYKVGVPKSGSTDPAHQGEVDAWTFSVADFGWQGPGLAVGPFNFERGAIKNPLDWRLDFEDRNSAGKKVEKGATPDQAVMVLDLGSLVKGSYTQPFPTQGAAYLALVVRAQLELKVAAPVVEFVTWGAERVAAEVGAGILTLGSADAVLTSAIAASAAAQWSSEAYEFLKFVRKASKYEGDLEDVIEVAKGSASLFAQQILPQVIDKAKAVVTKAISVISDAGKSTIKHVDGLIKHVHFRSAVAMASRAYSRPRKLTARPITRRLRFRAAGVPARRVQPAVNAVNRLAAGSPVVARTLLVAGRLTPGRRVSVAAKLPTSVKRGLTVLALVGPRRVAYERMLTASRGTSGATLRLPRHMAPGRWRIAISDLTALRRAGGSAQIALTEFGVKGRRRKPTPTPGPHPSGDHFGPAQVAAPLVTDPGPATNTDPAPVPPEWVRVGYDRRPCLDADAATLGQNGGKVQVRGCTGESQQHWTYDPADRSLRVRNGGRCLDADLNTIKNDGAIVQVWDCNGQPQQQWTFEKDGSIRSAYGARRCLDMDLNGGGADGTKVQLYTCNHALQQRWTR